MKVAIIGSGGREHALVWKFRQSLEEEAVFCLPGNGGITNSYPMDILDFKGIEDFCVEKGIDYLFVGPEVPLAAGIVDYFKNTSIKALGPTKAAAELEGSKIFSKQFMAKYGVATARFQTFTQIKDAYALVEEKKGYLVIKYDGLAAGKGVYVCDTVEEAMTALNEMEQKYGSDCAFLIEDKIIGQEISIIGFTDGRDIKLLLPSQDHKQLMDGDKGPNTGGMGAFCPVPFYTEELKKAIEERIVQPTLKGIQMEGMDYKGVIYFGIMIGDQGPELLEYNARFGDPETEVLLPSLKTDLAQIMRACLEENLADIDFEFHNGYFVDIVQVSGGYPKIYQKGHPIFGLDEVEQDILVFHAGTKKEKGEYLTNGGRVLNIVAQAETLEGAIAKAYEACSKINFENNFYRKDIGRRPHISREN